MDPRIRKEDGSGRCPKKFRAADNADILLFPFALSPVEGFRRFRMLGFFEKALKSARTEQGVFAQYGMELCFALTGSQRFAKPTNPQLGTVAYFSIL